MRLLTVPGYTGSGHWQSLWEAEDDRMRRVELRRLPFPALVIASESDPYCDVEQALRLAEDWGAGLLSVGDAGHINTASGHGPWPEGREQLCAFLARVVRR